MNKGILLLNFLIGLAAVAGLGYLIWRVDFDLLGIPTPTVSDMTTAPTPEPQAPPAASVPFGDTNASSSTPDSSELFRRHCVTCHGADGRGKTYVAQSEGMPSVADLTQLPDKSESTIRASITNGKGSMPAFGGRISEAELDALYLHLIPIINAGQTTK